MLLKIVIKSARNSWILTANCKTSPNQPKYQTLFPKKSPSQDFTLKTLRTTEGHLSRYGNNETEIQMSLGALWTHTLCHSFLNLHELSIQTLAGPHVLVIRDFGICCKIAKVLNDLHRNYFWNWYDTFFHFLLFMN